MVSPMSPSIVILTGAGISAESGLKTFRDQNGLWENYPVEDVASIEGFYRNPELVQRFYNERRAQLQQSGVKPNAAHQALAELEKDWPGNFLLVTQNVDDLHERGGSKNVLHMHGELLKVRCQMTEKVFSWSEAITQETRCSCCSKTGTLRPHIVWFGETPFEMERIYEALRDCDIFMAIGTSGQVYPAAGFVAEVPPSARTVEVNREPSAVKDAFQEHRIGLASIEVPRLVSEFIAHL